MATSVGDNVVSYVVSPVTRSNALATSTSLRVYRAVGTAQKSLRGKRHRAETCEDRHGTDVDPLPHAGAAEKVECDDTASDACDE